MGHANSFKQCKAEIPKNAKTNLDEDPSIDASEIDNRSFIWFIQDLTKKIQGLFKDISRTFYQFSRTFQVMCGLNIYDHSGSS